MRTAALHAPGLRDRQDSCRGAAPFTYADTPSDGHLRGCRRQLGTRFALILALPVLAVLGAASSVFACVVGTGTSASCTEAALNACLPGGGSFDGTVTFACGGAATITVTSTKTINANTTIDGGSETTISGGSAVGAFLVDSCVTFEVENLTIADGLSSTGGGAISKFNGRLIVTNSTFTDNRSTSVFGGGGIMNAGPLIVTNSTFSGNSATSGSFSAGGGAIATFADSPASVSNCTFFDNSAQNTGGAISNGTFLTVTNSIFSNNSITNGASPSTDDIGSTGGGAISNQGLLTVTDSTFSGNSAGFGGGGAIAGISNVNGSVDVTDCTFSGNSAGFDGGAIQNFQTLRVTNSSFYGNSADFGGGAIANAGTDFLAGTAIVTNSTFSANSAPSGAISGGGAILSTGIVTSPGSGIAVTLVNSILANSTGGNCFAAFGGTITDGGHNIDDGAACGFMGAGCAATTGTSFCNTNPLLDPAGLASNGGPTQTIALEGESPAINAGDETVCAVPPVKNLDQRGLVRPGAGATKCSIGAYESDAAPSATTTSTTTTTLGACLTTVTNTSTFPSSTSTSSTTSTTRLVTTTTTATPTTTTTTSTTTLPGCAAFPCGHDGTKVSICHIRRRKAGKRSRKSGKSRTLCIRRGAVPAHLNHGDHCGPCG